MDCTSLMRTVFFNVFLHNPGANPVPVKPHGEQIKSSDINATSTVTSRSWLLSHRRRRIFRILAWDVFITRLFLLGIMEGASSAEATNEIYMPRQWSQALEFPTKISTPFHDWSFSQLDWSDGIAIVRDDCVPRVRGTNCNLCWMLHLPVGTCGCCKNSGRPAVSSCHFSMFGVTSCLT